VTDQERIRRLRSELAHEASVAPDQVLVVRSPYRICPLGAHVDHQLGEVTGMALDYTLLFAFVPRADGRISVRSRNFPQAIDLSADEVPARPAGDWGDYLRGAVYALRRGGRPCGGLTGIVDGYEKVGGLSSSAAVGVAYLLALERAGGGNLAAVDNIELDRIIENDFIGLNNGPLDQSTILLSRAGHLMHLDCQSGWQKVHPCGAEADLHAVILYSGLRKLLSDTDYNRRVAECEEAARLLLEAARMDVPPSPKLRHVPREVHAHFASRLPEPLRRRAQHFFGETARVREGVRCWVEGKLERFGQLITASGRSSIENYECGNAYLRTAYDVLRETPGVLGARFSGAGFRGCCIGLAAQCPPAELADDILARYLKGHPDMEGAAEVRFCRTADGAGLV